MGTGSKYINILAKKILGVDDLKTRFLEYMLDRVSETNKQQYETDFFHPVGVSITADGNDQIQLSDASGPGDQAIGSDGLGNFLEYWNSVHTGIQFENASAIDYYVGLKYCIAPDEIQINPDTGQPEFVSWEDQIGESADPDLVTDNGNNTITFRVNSVLESGVDHSGRTVAVYKNIPGPLATTEALAKEELTVSYSGGNNTVTTIGTLGQSTISETEADYTVICKGPSVKRNTDLEAAAGYAYIGTVTGAGAGNPPSTFDTSDQKVVPYNWTSVLVDGLPQNFWPATDDTYSLGTATHRWSEIHTVDFIMDGNFLPETDDAQDLGSGTFRWRDCYLSGSFWCTTIELSSGGGSGIGVHSEWTATDDDTYDLGKPSYQWKDLYLDGVAYIDTLSLSSTGGEGCDGHFAPTIDDTYDLGTTSYHWRSCLANDIDCDTIYVLASSGNGVMNDFVPDTNDSHNLGNGSYRWNTFYIDDIDIIGTITFDYTGSPNGISSDLRPNASDTYNLGISTRRWGTLYSGDLNLLTDAGRGCSSSLMPTTSESYGLGSTSYRWYSLYIDLIDLSEANGEGFSSDIRPNTDSANNIGDTSYQWNNLWITGTGDIDTLLLSTTGGNGVASSANPTIDDNFNIGSPTYQWHDGYFANRIVTLEINLSTSGEETPGFVSNCGPVYDNTYDLGSSSYRWRHLYVDGVAYIDRLELAEISGEGIDSDTNPAGNDVHNLGSGSYQWRDLYLNGTAFIDVFRLSTNSLEGVDTNLYPAMSNAYSLGSATRYYNDIYADSVYYKTNNTTFDEEDDLKLVSGYVPTNETITIEKKGIKKIVKKASPESIPWPMLGDKDPETGDYFLHAGDSITFLLGAIKQLYNEHKKSLLRIEELEMGLNHKPC
jgi:hypothetical protein